MTFTAVLLAGCGGGGGGGGGYGGDGGSSDDTTSDESAGSGTAVDWTYEDIATGDAVGLYPRIAVDSLGNPHVVSLDFRPGVDVYTYSVRDGTGTWTSTNIASATNVCTSNIGVISDIAVDSVDSPHVSLESPDEAVKYGVYSGDWNVEDISTNLCPYPGASADESWAFVGANAIGIDTGTDTAWVVARLYNSLTGGDFTLRYWKTGDSGTSELDRETEPGAGTGRSPDIDVDSAGTPHVSYVRTAGASTLDDLIRYATWDGTRFVTETVANLGNSSLGKETAIAADSKGRPHILYYQGGVGYQHAVNDGSGWVTETFTSDTAGAGLIWMDMAIGQDDVIHVVYFTSPGSIRYTRKRDGTWSDGESLSTVGDQRPSIAVDDTGTVHIVWRDAYNDKLEYVFGTP